jgi:hypothetical protein
VRLGPKHHWTDSKILASSGESVGQSQRKTGLWLEHEAGGR